jgi:hypothetical protein
MATLETRLRDLATRVGTECKALRTFINGNAADLSTLTTTAKTSLVAAVNEVNAKPSGATINDAATNGTSVWSSTKTSGQITTQVNAVLGAATPAALDSLKEIATALGDDANFSATMTTALGKRVRVDAAQTFTAPEKAQAKANIDAYGNLEIGNPDTDFVAVFNTALA